MDCLFCKIINKEIPATIVYEDNDFLAFEDIRPMAKVHLLLIPKKHINSLNYLEEANALLYGKLLIKGKEIARKLKIDQSGYRFVINCNEDSGMEVEHLHLHILGGNKLGSIC